MAQPFLTDQQILGQTPETAEIARQRKIADLLTSQAFTQPQGGMVSGRYVAPSIAQQLQPLASALGGSYLSAKTDQKADALAKALRQKQVAEIEEYSRLQETDPGAALGFALASNNPTLQNIAKEELKGVKLGPEDIFTRPRLGGGVTEMRGAQKQVSNQVVAPGGALVSPTGQVLYQAPYKPEPSADQDGGYNRKGDWITPNGIFIGKSEVAKDREIAFTADQVRQGLQQISPQDVKKATSVFGSVTGSGPINYLVQQSGNEAVAAQTKINASSVMQILNNLPPGPASDKDIENAKSTFPGYGNEKTLNDWVKNTKATLDRKVNSLNQKYGSENWYGNVGLSSTPQTSQSGGVVDYNALPKRK
jgi:hypothetical protein